MTMSSYFDLLVIRRCINNPKDITILFENVEFMNCSIDIFIFGVESLTNNGMAILFILLTCPLLHDLLY